MPRRSPGTGSIDTLPSGRKRVRVHVGKKRRTLGVFADEVEAETMRAAGWQEIADAERAGPATLAAFGAAHLERREREGVRGHRTERGAWDRHVAEHAIAKLPLAELTRPAVVAWLADVVATPATVSARGQGRGARVASSRPLSRSSVAQALHALRTAVLAARDAGHLTGDPTEGVKVPRTVSSRVAAVDPWTYLTPEEIARVETCEAIPERERLLYVVAIYTGLRRGELFALRRESVRLDGPAPEVTVRGSHGGATKTGKVRRVPLLPAARDALRLVLASHENALVFPSETGGRRTKDDDARWAPQVRRWTKTDGTHVNYTVAGYRERAGITRRVRFHDLRHTCASHLLMGTWGVALQLHEVSAWLGHSSVTMTERYAHLDPGRLAARVAQAVPTPPASRDLRRDLRKVTLERAPSQNALFTARPEGLEPPTLRSEVCGVAGSSREVGGRRDLRVTSEGLRVDLRGVAVKVLTAVARREPLGELTTELATEAVLAGLGEGKVAGIFAGGPLAVRLAVELAAEVLRAAGEGVAEETGT